MALFLDYNPSNGVEEWVDVDDRDRLQIHYRQDVEPVLELAKIERNDGLADKNKQSELRLYARIPPVVVLALRNKGINIFDRNDLKRAFREINENYPYLKTTEMHHELKC